MAACRQQPAVRLLDRVRQRPRGDQPPVGEEEQRAAAGAVHRRRAHEPCHSRRGVLGRACAGDRQQSGREVRPAHRAERRTQVVAAIGGGDLRIGARPVGGQYRAPVRAQPERHRGIRERVRAHRLHDGACLRLRRAQEPSPRRQRREQLAHVDAGPGRRRRTARALRQPAAIAHHRRRLRICRPRHAVDVGRRDDRRQRLTPEAERLYREEVVLRPELRGRVPLESVRQFLGRDTAAVVAHADAVAAAALDGDLDHARPGVERVLDQLLHHRRRTLDHLAGGDARGDRGRQHADRAAYRHRRGQCRLTVGHAATQPSTARRWRASWRSSYSRCSASSGVNASGSSAAISASSAVAGATSSEG